MKFDMNIKTKLTVSIGVLVAMIVLLVSLSSTQWTSFVKRKTQRW